MSDLVAGEGDQSGWGCTDVLVGDEAELAEVRWVSLAEADELLPGMFAPVRRYLARELGKEPGK